MKFKGLLAAGLMMLAVAVPASAQFRFGVKAGVSINELKFDNSALDASNRTGFTGGLMCEFNFPVLNLGLDASVLYAQRDSKYTETNDQGAEINSTNIHNSYIDIPINLKWKIGIPVVGRVIKPFLTTGPDFSLLVSKKTIKEDLKNRDFLFSWNVGAGVEIMNRVQLAASYGIPLGNSASFKNVANEIFSDAKNRCWTITAAYLF